LKASLPISAHAIRRDSCHGSASGVTLSTTTNRRAANGSTEASSNVNSMASTAEEMTASVREISHQVQESARMASDANRQGDWRDWSADQWHPIFHTRIRRSDRSDRNSIEKLSGISSVIASAIEEQVATTQEVARNVQHAARGAQDVSSNVGNLQARSCGNRNCLVRCGVRRANAVARQFTAQGRGQQLPEFRSGCIEHRHMAGLFDFLARATCDDERQTDRIARFLRERRSRFPWDRGASVELRNIIT
jgi:hypothetical protein